MKPIEIARRLNISTSALRHYESWGIVPKAERGTNGYREYTDEHVAYFECIRAMNTGFGMNVIRKVLPLIQQGDITSALWIVNEVQVEIYQHKKKAEQALSILKHNKK
ncbi:MerR family transcriptional regulator [Bacillus sp. JCM 19034]|uniref:MerR family transcriptional regulator n=1 Tax=Bacillus sp. JCM 19034 TaxID=1481928 RepID=UPI000785B366|nr:MerR family transcriptional regulator [Bacillus sp. JCM 19034]